MPNIFGERQRTIKLVIFDKLINFPLLGAQVFFTLSVPKMILAGFSFLKSRVKAFLFGITETKHLDEWIIRRFGKVLYNIYFGPYLERVQKKQPHFLSADIGCKKIPVLSIRQYIKREWLKRNEFNPDDYHTYKTFYCINGYGEFSNFFLNELKKMRNVTILLNEPIQEVHFNDNKVSSIKTDKNTYSTKDFDVISTLPLELLVTSIVSIDLSIKEAAQKLEYTKMRFFLIKVKQPSVIGFSWVNFNDPKFPYYRVSEEVYDEFNMTPVGYSSLCFEIPLNVDDAFWTISDVELLQIILASFNTVFSLKEDDIIDTKSIFIDHANPRMALGYHESLEIISSFIDGTKNLYSIGRQGLFTYVNLDGCTRMALQFSNGYIKSKGKEANRDLFKEFHNITIS
jgi:protoporphyrinogen oxidase